MRIRKEAVLTYGSRTSEKPTTVGIEIDGGKLKICGHSRHSSYNWEQDKSYIRQGTELSLIISLSEKEVEELRDILNIELSRISQEKSLFTEKLWADISEKNEKIRDLEDLFSKIKASVT